MLSGLLAAASTLDPVLMSPACGCPGEWFRPSDSPVSYGPSLAVALVAAIRFVFARTPPPSSLPVAVAGRHLSAAFHALRIRCAASRPLRCVLGVVNVVAAAVVLFMLLIAADGELSDHAPFVMSHVLLVGLVVARGMLSRVDKVS